jgi:hypothetical protein
LTSTILFSSGTNEQQLPQHHTAEGTSPTSAEASICTLPPPPPQPVHAKPVDEFPCDHEWSDWLKTFHKPHYPIPLEAFWIVPKFDKSDDSPNVRSTKDRVRDRKADILKAHQLCMSAFDNIRGLFLQPSPTDNNWVDCSDFDLYDKGVQYKGTRKPIFSKRFEKQQGYFCMFHALDCLFDCATFNARLADAAIPALLNAFAFPPEMLDREIADAQPFEEEILEDKIEFNTLLDFSHRLVPSVVTRSSLFIIYLLLRLSLCYLFRTHFHTIQYRNHPNFIRFRNTLASQKLSTNGATCNTADAVFCSFQPLQQPNGSVLAMLLAPCLAPCPCSLPCLALLFALLSCLALCSVLLLLK